MPKGRKGRKEAPKKADEKMWSKPEMQALDAFTRDILKVSKTEIDEREAKRPKRSKA